MKGVILAGHLCLDLIPTLPRAVSFSPGTLANVGSLGTSTGGCVPNTGLTLHRLGTPVRLLAKIGDDPFGGIVRRSLSAVDPDLARGLLAVPGEDTSYSVILSPPGWDRIILHYPGANDTFAAEDLPEDLRAVLPDAAIFHFGYPPIMRRMFEDGGENLRRVLRHARSAGLTTSLDMAYPDPNSGAGEADWETILATALPEVDVFQPSLEETLLMLEPETYREVARRDPALLSRASAGEVSSLGERLVSLGAAVVVIKAGERGLYVRTAPRPRLETAGPGLPEDHAAWDDREIWSSAFESSVVGTTGAGDAAAAGFLRALLDGLSPEGAATMAAAVGATSVEAPDATGGVRGWRETRERVEEGWPRRDASPGEGWREGRDSGLWVGPRDARNADGHV